MRLAMICRVALIALVLTFAVVSNSALAAGPAGDISAAAAKQQLVDGNKRFVQGNLMHPNQSIERRNEVAQAQHPLAIVVGCSDSRVPPEVVFDQGIGDLFVVRVAGNILNDENIGSVEYAAEHLGAPLVIVLGHQRCGAVTAAVKGGEAPGHIEDIVKAIEPAVDEAKKKCGKCDLVEKAAHINVQRAVRQLRTSEPLLAEMVKSGKLTVAGAFYDLDSGTVNFMK